MKYKCFHLNVLFFTTLALIISPDAFGHTRQKVGKYAFNDFPVSVSLGHKVKINYASNETARTFKTRITMAYRQNAVNFGGHYIATSWGCGMGCLMGAMVDVKTGIV